MKNIYKALAQFQQEVPTIHKGTNGFKYDYASLSDILEKINPLLKKYGLGFSQPILGSNLKTIVFHFDSGEFLESEIEIPQDVNLNGMNDFQIMGSAITYFRRYSLSSILGLVTDSDNDASGEQIKDQKEWLNPNTAKWIKSIEKNAPLDTVLKHFKISKSNQEIYKNELQKNTL